MWMTEYMWQEDKWCIATQSYYTLLENRSITTMKYGCNRDIFVAIPSNSNKVTLVKSVSK
jgi:hypothetical protein